MLKIVSINKLFFEKLLLLTQMKAPDKMKKSLLNSEGEMRGAPRSDKFNKAKQGVLVGKPNLILTRRVETYPITSLPQFL